MTELPNLSSSATISSKSVNSTKSVNQPTIDYLWTKINSVTPETLFYLHSVLQSHILIFFFCPLLFDRYLFWISSEYISLCGNRAQQTQISMHKLDSTVL